MPKRPRRARGCDEESSGEIRAEETRKGSETGGEEEASCYVEEETQMIPRQILPVRAPEHRRRPLILNLSHVEAFPGAPLRTLDGRLFSELSDFDREVEVVKRRILGLPPLKVED